MHPPVQFMVKKTNFTVDETSKLNPKNIYGLSKKIK